MRLCSDSNTLQPIDQLSFEHVERKGLGHPDTLCDSIAERASQLYSQYCLNQFGRVANHWFDKVMLIGGESRIDFQIGELLRPYHVIFAGKVTYRVGNVMIPVRDILEEACDEVLSQNLTGFNKAKHLNLDIKLVDYQGAGRLRSRYQPKTVDELVSLNDFRTFTSNDCNMVSGFAPFTSLERMVLQIELYLNSPLFKEGFPYTGWDVKVFGSRSDDQYELVINLPFLGQHLLSLQDYQIKKQEVFEELMSWIQITEPKCSVALTINPQDRNGKLYLTSLGSAADTGDVGVVGRGNRLNGLITPMRSMSIEAPCGKNPLDHTGKIYAHFANEIANKLHARTLQGIEVYIFTTKESKLIDPDQIVIRSTDPSSMKEEELRHLVESELLSMDSLLKKLILGNVHETQCSCL